MNKKEINQLIIIGNGFDLAHGLKTSYKDFMAWVLKSDLTGSPNESNFIDFADFPSYALPRDYLINDTFEYFYDFLTKTLNGGKVEFRNPFFEHLVLKTGLNNWVDIEQEYYNELILCFKNKSKYNIDILNDGFKQIQTLLEGYLYKFKHEYIRPSPKISTYLKTSPRLNENNTINPVLICNFNYTGTIGQYLKDDTELKYDDICFIHGEINREINPIVFGYGDEKEENYKAIENSKDDRFLEYTKSFAYLRTPYYSKLLSFIEAEPYEVVIMGHSCGQSDRVLLKTIFEHKNCKEIIIKYHKRSDGSNDFDEKAKQIARSFDDKALFRKRVANFQDERVAPLT